MSTACRAPWLGLDEVEPVSIGDVGKGNPFPLHGGGRFRRSCSWFYVLVFVSLLLLLFAVVLRELWRQFYVCACAGACVRAFRVRACACACA